MGVLLFLLKFPRAPPKSSAHLKVLKNFLASEEIQLNWGVRSPETVITLRSKEGGFQILPEL